MLEVEHQRERDIHTAQSHHGIHHTHNTQMGIPSYQSHLRRKYAKHIGRWLVPTLPANCECANLYVDLNGIVHSCAYKVYSQYEKEQHSASEGLSYQQVEAKLHQDNASDELTTSLYPTLFAMVISDIQTLLDCAQPTELVYLALDGVAPRAKMEQQQQRRYRASQDKDLERGVYHKHRRAYIRGQMWDSNCVTPGTTFMTALAEYLHAHVHDQLTSPGAGPDFQVILSDATEHGEGEHKVMDHLREAGDPNDTHTSTDESGVVRTHVLYGQDADLVMLGLSYRTQFPNAPFFLLRERDTQQMPSGTSSKKKSDEVRGSALAEHPSVKGLSNDSSTGPPASLRMQFLAVHELQTHIIRHMESYGDVYTETEHPQVTRDYVAMCFLLGNDFLPHSPSLAIQDKGVDMLFEVYVPLRKTHGAYLTHEHSAVDCGYDDGSETEAVCTPKETHFNHTFLTQLIQKLAQQEDYLAGRIHSQTLQKRKWALMQQRYPSDKSALQPTGIKEPPPTKVTLPVVVGTEDAEEDTENTTENTENTTENTENTTKNTENTENTTEDTGDIVQAGREHTYKTPPPPMSSKRYLHPNAQQHTFAHDIKHLQTLPPGMWAMDDKVMAGTPGWKGRYYKEVERVRNMQDVHEMCRNYMEGLFWTLQYYFHGCWSTSWYYRYLSAPLFSNMAHFLEQPRTNVNRLLKSNPEWTCTPIEQLRLVLPRSSYRRWVGTEAEAEAPKEERNGCENEAGMCDGGSHMYRLVPFAKRFRWECGVRLG